jgi:hypothetical protein
LLRQPLSIKKSYAGAIQCFFSSSHRGVENVKVLLENSVSVEGDLLVLDFSLAMEKVRIL